MRKLIIRSIWVWVLFIPVAIGNGVLREVAYKQLVGDLAAHQISTIVAATAYFLLAYWMLRGLVDAVKIYVLFAIGCLWVAMTVTFEFSFGHYVDNVPWEKLLADYNIFAGHVWGIFLLLIFFTPYIIKITRPRT